MKRLSNRQGTISKLTGKRSKPYMVRTSLYFDETEQKFKRQIIGYAKTKQDAYMMLAEFNLKNINIQDANNIRLKDLYKYVLDKKEKIVSKKRIYNINSIFQNMMGVFMERKVASLKYLEIQSHIDNYPSTSVSVVIGVLKEIYKESMKRDIITKDISVLLEPPLHIKKEKKENFKSEEVKFLWNEYETNKNVYATILLIQLYSGCRISEVTKLKVDDVDFENMVFITGVKTKAGIDRYIPIHKKIKKVFEYLIENNKMGSLFFKLNHIAKYVSNYLKINNIDKSSHIARHTFITNMQILDAPLKDLQYIVGHKSQDITTAVYTHLGIETAIKMIEIVNKLEY